MMQDLPISHGIRLMILFLKVFFFFLSVNESRVFRHSVKNLCLLTQHCYQLFLRLHTA